MAGSPPREVVIPTPPPNHQRPGGEATDQEAEGRVEAEGAAGEVRAVARAVARAEEEAAEEEAAAEDAVVAEGEASMAA